MELFPLHCEHSGSISRFHALMEKDKQKTEAAFYSLMETPHAEAAKNWSCFILPSGNVAWAVVQSKWKHTHTHTQDVNIATQMFDLKK